MLDSGANYFVALDTEEVISREGVSAMISSIAEAEATDIAPFPNPSFCFLSYTINPPIKPNIWVKLTELPHPFAHDEALLICQHSTKEWIVWIPDFGEAIVEI